MWDKVIVVWIVYWGVEELVDIYGIGIFIYFIFDGFFVNGNFDDDVDIFGWGFVNWYGVDMYGFIFVMVFVLFIVSYWFKFKFLVLYCI